jgi:formylmethanofuran dehydrogenase subunit E
MHDRIGARAARIVGSARREKSNGETMKDPEQKMLESLLKQTEARHTHLCPRQILGVRIGLAGALALGLETPRTDRRLLIIVETDGCFVDGVEVATGASVGHRTLRVEDYGKVAATFVDVKSEQAVRVAPHLDVREKARRYAPEERRHYFAQLRGYQVMPDDELLHIRPVHLAVPVGDIVSRAGVRVSCAQCGEEIINGREVAVGNRLLCCACAGPAYYHPAGDAHELPVNAEPEPHALLLLVPRPPDCPHTGDFRHHHKQDRLLYLAEGPVSTMDRGDE